MIIAKNEDWVNEELEVSVDEVSDTEVENIFLEVKQNQNRFEWALSKKGELLDEEIIKDKIKSGIKIIVIERFKFNFVNDPQIEIAIFND